jgi:long-chain acyl-CoA synthetase
LSRSAPPIGSIAKGAATMHSPEIQALIATAQQMGGQPPSRRRVPFRNLRHVLSLHTYSDAGRTFMIAYDEDGGRETLSYGETLARAGQIANLLHDDLGVRRGMRVATLLYNHSDTVMLYLACWLIGAVVVPQVMTEDDARIAYILRNSGATLLVAHSSALARAERLLQWTDADGGRADNIRQLVLTGDPTVGAGRYLHLREGARNLSTAYLADESMPKGNDTALLPLGPESPTLDDEALLVYTSGTTGAPKGVILTQYQLLVDAHSIAQWQGITGDQRLMCVLPIHHVNGIVVTLITPLLVGGSVVLNRSFQVSTFWERLIRDKVHIVSIVPTLLQFLLEHSLAAEARGEGWFGVSSDGGAIHRRGMSHFRHFICGAGTLSVKLISAFQDRFGFTVLHGYGLSETTCYSCFLPIDLTWNEHLGWLRDHGYPSIGCPIASNEMAIMDSDGKALGPNERGEICVRGHNVMQGYAGRPDANAHSFAYGWFRTGDEGFYLTDALGRDFFFITGRLKELINRGGTKFSPFEIEEVLLSVQGVRVGLAVGFPNTYYGEEVGAYVVLEAGAQLHAADILAACETRLGWDKSPKVVVFGQDVPVTSTGKWQRLRLAPLFSEWEQTQFKRG